jgi:flagellar hook-associated protein 1 FlgK
MPGVSSVLDIGKWALFGNQAAIETTGNNIANVNTPGYSRREIRFEERISIDYRPGQLGTGVNASEVIRYFDNFIEAQYNDKASTTARYKDLWNNLKSADSLFNESNSTGISSSLTDFFSQWQNLSLQPNDYSMRSALLGQTQNLTTVLRTADANLQSMQRQAEQMAQQEVESVNALLQQIAAVNKQIGVHNIPGVNNANELLDKRDLLVRQLSEKMDVTILTQGSSVRAADGTNTSDGADWMLVTKAGQTLVQGDKVFEIKYEGPKAMTSLSQGSTFDGQINFEGASSFEYRVEMVQAGDVSSGSGAAQFRVSMDGGQTWLKDSDGNERRFAARPEGLKVGVQDLGIWFSNATQPLSVGDTFNIVPKNGIYWYKNTSEEQNITPQLRGDGSDDTTRLTGGSLCSLMSFAGSYIGKYRDKLEAMTKSLVWETNRLHSQGAGLTAIADVTGTYSVINPALALGSDSSGLIWSDRLTSGNTSVYIYTTDSTALVSCASFGPLDFDPGVPGIQNFDPARHSLNDVRNAFNNTFGQHLTATIEDNRLRITARAGYKMGFGDDTSGLMAGLGINTYFSGATPGDVGINDAILNDPSRINAGHINGAGEFNAGDNTTAAGIADIAYTKVSIIGAFDHGSSQTISEFYSTLVATVGGDTSNAKFLYQYNSALADDLDSRQNAISGVNLDEEMSNLIKFQNSYRAAAKLITTADEMLQIVIGLKQ